MKFDDSPPKFCSRWTVFYRRLKGIQNQHSLSLDPMEWTQLLMIRIFVTSIKLHWRCCDESCRWFKCPSTKMPVGSTESLWWCVFCRSCFWVEDVKCADFRWWKIGHVYNPFYHRAALCLCSRRDPIPISKAAFRWRYLLIFWSYMFMRRHGFAGGLLQSRVFYGSGDHKLSWDGVTARLHVDFVSIP